MEKVHKAQEKKSKVAVIIPAYNEEKRIKNVLEAATSSSLVDEIIVVDDGSEDGTSEVAKGFGVKVLKNPVNKGKGAAIQKGISATDADIVTFLDADLIGLTSEHVNSLIKPLLEDEDLTMTVGKFAEGRMVSDLGQKFTPFVSGQRAIRRTFLREVPDLAPAGFGVETILTRLAKKKKAKVKEVILERAGQIVKEEKLGFWRGLFQRLRMYKDIFKYFLFPPKAFKKND